MTVATTPNVENLKTYIAANTDNCGKCGVKFFWVSTSRGKRIPMDFPDQIYRGKLEPTHELVLTYDENGEWVGEVTALAYKSKASHTCHWDTCEKKR